MNNMGQEINRWHISKNLEEKYTPIIKSYLNKISKLTSEEFEGLSDEDIDNLQIDFTETLLAPYHICQLIEKFKEFGYRKTFIDKNGWEQDFWIKLISSKGYFDLVLDCCGMTKECVLKLYEYL